MAAQLKKEEYTHGINPPTSSEKWRIYNYIFIAPADDDGST
jgi:hypothetical protein